MRVTLESSQWDEPPPECPECALKPMAQEFVAPAIVGSNRARAVALAEDIAANDYGVADINLSRREGIAPKVRYKDDNRSTKPQGNWGGVNPEALESALAMGRQTRMQHGSSLDIIQTMPDYIANSKKLSVKVW
jgi:hypothetical protein